MKKCIFKHIKVMGAHGFKCKICGAPNGDKVCPDCKAKGYS